MITIDGSMGEGGGQILRSSLALSLLTGSAFRIERIRAGRARPGLMRQHLVALSAAGQVGNAEVSGDELGSLSVTFRPRMIRGGNFTFSTGGAGSTTLVFQTILLPLVLGTEEPSRIAFEGGTHNPMAPPFEFLETTFLPLVRKMGVVVHATLEHPGFYPAGGGSWSASIHPQKELGRLELLHRGEIFRTHAVAHVSLIPPSIGLRETAEVARLLAWDDPSATAIHEVKDPKGPGNALQVFVESEHVTEVITGFGERGVRAEAVAKAVAEETKRYLATDVPVGEHLADQLLLPLALAKGGTFRTLGLSMHTKTQIEILKLFLDVKVNVIQEEADVVRITVDS